VHGAPAVVRLPEPVAQSDPRRTSVRFRPTPMKPSTAPSARRSTAKGNSRPSWAAKDPRAEVLAREVELLREALTRSKENAERWRIMVERQQALLEDRRQAGERPRPKEPPAALPGPLRRLGRASGAVGPRTPEDTCGR
jgi:hypothetical protein